MSLDTSEQRRADKAALHCSLLCYRNICSVHGLQLIDTSRVDMRRKVLHGCHSAVAVDSKVFELIESVWHISTPVII